MSAHMPQSISENTLPSRCNFHYYYSLLWFLLKKKINKPLIASAIAQFQIRPTAHELLFLSTSAIKPYAMARAEFPFLQHKERHIGRWFVERIRHETMSNCHLHHTLDVLIIYLYGLRTCGQLTSRFYLAFALFSPPKSWISTWIERGRLTLSTIIIWLFGFFTVFLLVLPNFHNRWRAMAVKEQRTWNSHAELLYFIYVLFCLINNKKWHVLQTCNETLKLCLQFF